ncbi:hypothetical protein BsWGS_19836 [Bradybaena similaris]
MRKRRSLTIVFLFGVVSIIVLSLSRSTSLQFSTLSKLLFPDEELNQHHQFMIHLGYGKFNVVISDVNDTTSSLGDKRKQQIVASRCPNILSGMTTGKWLRRPLTQQEQTTIDAYLHKERGFYRIPPSYQRSDGRCADVAYENSPLYVHMWFKAICNPKGDTPCCHTNKCVNLTEADCRCPTCYDERQAINAEYAQWKTEDDRCQVKNFTAQEACTVLSGTNLNFVGDSFIRHVFVAMVIVLTNNPEGALKESTPQQFRDQCKGMHQITWSVCRDYLEQNRSLCGGAVKVVYTEVFPAKQFYLTTPLLRALRHINKSIVVLGLGIHDNFHMKTVEREFLFPFISLYKSLNTNTPYNMNLENVLTTLGNVSISPPVFDINKLNQMNLHLYSLNTTSAKPVFNTRSPLNMHGNQHNIQRNTINTTADNVNKTWGIDSQARNNSTDVIQFTKLPDANNLDFQRFHAVKEDSSLTSSLFRVRRRADKGSVSQPIVSQTSPPPMAENNQWPRLLWLGIHAPGLLKSPKFREQTAEGVQNFNKNVYAILKQFQVPYLDTFDFTKGIVSFDGTHYGWGINMLKVNMLLTYIQHDLADAPGWS